MNYARLGVAGGAVYDANGIDHLARDHREWAMLRRDHPWLASSIAPISSIRPEGHGPPVAAGS